MVQTKLDAPASQNTVRVRMVDTSTTMALRAISFIKPIMPGHETMNMPDIAFLVENERLGKKAMFDLGVRKDWWNLTPTTQKRLDVIGVGMKTPKDVKDILTEKNISVESINDIIWSHTHWDHTGDTTLFPHSTNLVHGPGIPTMAPFYPDNPNSPVPAALFQNRRNIEITFQDEGLKIGGFPAHDFYDDGSFYLLSTPGHAIGHLCGLARTTPDTFILMGGDICHFPGDLRPNETYPLPDPIPDGVLDKVPSFPYPCPASFFLDEHPQHQNPDAHDKFNARTTPLYALSTAKGGVYETPSPEVAKETVDTLTSQFDTNPHVFVCIAHDPSLLPYLPTLNSNPDEDLNDWFAKGWKDKCYWGWLNEMARKGKPGRGPAVEGWWVGEKRYETAKEVVEAFSEKESMTGGQGGKL